MVTNLPQLTVLHETFKVRILKLMVNQKIDFLTVSELAAVSGGSMQLIISVTNVLKAVRLSHCNIEDFSFLATILQNEANLIELKTAGRGLQPRFCMQLVVFTLNLSLMANSSSSVISTSFLTFCTLFVISMSFTQLCFLNFRTIGYSLLMSSVSASI